jgi:hypothetical protein
VEAIKTKLADPPGENEKAKNRFLWIAVDMVTHNGSQRAIAAVADLCSIDEKDCPWMVKALLDSGGAKSLHRFETVCNVIEGYPSLMDFVAPWVERAMSYSEERRFAQELRKREKAGHSMESYVPLWSRLSIQTRDRVAQAVETERREERR